MPSRKLFICQLLPRNPENLTRHAFPVPRREPRLFFEAILQMRSAARNFALRDRGLRSISSSPGVTGFFVNNR